MEVKVLKPFPYSENGRDVVTLEPGVREVRDELVPGLIGDGLICGDGHDHPLLSQGRRNRIIERALETGRKQLAAMTDEELLAFDDEMDRRERDRLNLETSADGPDETGAPVILEDDDRDDDPMLYGSSLLPSHLTIGRYDVQLGGLVGAAFRESGIETVRAWNDEPEDVREKRLAATLERLQADPEGTKAEYEHAIVGEAQVAEDGDAAGVEQPQPEPDAAELTPGEPAALPPEAELPAADGQPAEHGLAEVQTDTPAEDEASGAAGDTASGPEAEDVRADGEALARQDTALTPAQEAALDRDGDGHAGGSPKGGNRRNRRSAADAG